jgi:hypothetical protein
MEHVLFIVARAEYLRYEVKFVIVMLGGLSKLLCRVEFLILIESQACRVFCRSDKFSRSSYVDDNSCLLVSSLPSLYYRMTSHRDIYIYEMLRNDYIVPTRCRHRGVMVDPLGCKTCRAMR